MIGNLPPFWFSLHSLFQESSDEHCYAILRSIQRRSCPCCLSWFLCEQHKLERSLQASKEKTTRLIRVWRRYHYLHEGSISYCMRNQFLIESSFRFFCQRQQIQSCPRRSRGRRYQPRSPWQYSHQGWSTFWPNGNGGNQRWRQHPRERRVQGATRSRAACGTAVSA